MGERLTPADFTELFRYFKDSAWRLEVQPSYLVEYEQPAFAEFLKGNLIEPPELDWYRPWLDQIRATTAEGRRIGRVRVMPEPLTDYARWEIWAGQWNVEAGEDIRYLSKRRAVEIGLPLSSDWWLFDSERLAMMKFDQDGRPLGGEIVIDPTVVVDHCAWRDLAIQHSAPTAEQAA